MWWLLLVFFAAFSSLNAQSPLIPEEKGVLLLTDDTFAAAFRRYRPLLVLIDEPTREGSWSVFRHFADAATAVRITRRHQNPSVRFATLNVSASPSIVQSLSVTSLPSIFKFDCASDAVFETTPLAESEMVVMTPSNIVDTEEDLSKIDSKVLYIVSKTSNNPIVTVEMPVFGALSSGSEASTCSLLTGEVQQYYGSVSSLDFQQFMGSSTPLKSVRQILNVTQLNEIVMQEPLLVLFVVEGRDSQAYYDCHVLSQLDAFEWSSYAYSLNNAIIPEAERTQVPLVALYKDYGRQRVVLPLQSIDTSLSSIRSAILMHLFAHRYPLVSIYSNTSPAYYYDPLAVAHVMVFVDEAEAYYAELEARLTQVAVAFNPRPDGFTHVRFVIVPRTEVILRNALVVPDHQLPTVLVLSDLKAPPQRWSNYGTALVGLLDANQTFVTSLSAFVETELPSELVLGPSIGDPSSSLPTNLFENLDDLALESNATIAAQVLKKTITRQRGLRTIDIPVVTGPQELTTRSIVLFASHRCGACVAFQETYKQLAAAFPSMAFYAVDVDALMMDVAAFAAFEVETLPAIFYYSAHQEPVAYTKPSVAFDDVASFILQSV